MPVGTLHLGYPSKDQLEGVLPGEREPLAVPQDAGGELAVPAGAGHRGAGAVEEGAPLRREGGELGEVRR